MAAPRFAHLGWSVLVADKCDSALVDGLRAWGVNVTEAIGSTETQLAAIAAKHDVIVVRSATKITRPIIEAGKAGALKIIGRAGVGVDNIDCVVANALGVKVVNTPDANTLSAAEHTCALMMALCRHVVQAGESMHLGEWNRTAFTGCELNGKTLGVVGLGRVGREVAKRMAAFNMKLIGYDPLVPAAVAEAHGIKFATLEEVLRAADVITLHVPLLDETRNLLNAQTMTTVCKKGFRLVNCARGGIVNEADLVTVVNSGHCAGAALDVFDEEPTKNTALFSHPKIICTPHLGASTVEAQKRVSFEMLDRLEEAISTFAAEHLGTKRMSEDEVAPTAMVHEI